MKFADRGDAGRQLARALFGYKASNPVIFALPRGGVPVAEQIARSLGAPLDIIFVRKIGAPFQPEVAIGAVVDGLNPVFVHNEIVERQLGISPESFDQLGKKELIEIERRRQIFQKYRHPLDPAGRVAIVVDDGIATGATMLAALRAIRSHSPERLVLAAPVASRQALMDMREEADDIVVLTLLEPYGAVGHFYDDFAQLTDEDVVVILKSMPEKSSSVDA